MKGCFTIKTEAKTFIERLFCSTCKKEMLFSGHVLSSYPPQYPHHCDGCDGHVITDTRYPREFSVENK